MIVRELMTKKLKKYSGDD